MPPKKTPGEKPAKGNVTTTASQNDPATTDQASTQLARPVPEFTPRVIPTTNPDLTEYIKLLRGAENSALGRISQLPVLRAMNLRPNNTFKLQTPKGDRPSYLSSAAGQIRGTEHTGDEACLRCINGNGHYMECVTVQNEFKGACCNCSFDSGLSKCSFFVAPDKPKSKGEDEAKQKVKYETDNPPEDCKPTSNKFNDHDSGSGTGGNQKFLA